MTSKLILGFFAVELLLAGLALGQSPAAATKVLMKTNKGDITLELYPSKAPVTVKNFLGYVKDGFYNGTIFHRVIPDFMIQGGGLSAEMHEKGAKAQIKNEAANGLKNLRGTMAMARTSDVDSATCQFFINLKDNGFLDHTDNTAQGFGYCVFGKVVAGMDVVDAIAMVKTGKRGPYENVPREPVIILSVEVLNGK